MRTAPTEHLIRQHLAVLVRAITGAIDGDAESLHQARVVTRRLRATLPLLPPGKKVAKLTRAVRRLTRTLGPVRELDVALLILDELSAGPEPLTLAIERLRETIGHERRSLQDNLRRRLERFDVERFGKRAIAAARRQETRHTDPGSAMRDSAAHGPAQRRAGQLLPAIESAAGLYLPDRLHEVRIAVKKLRYSLELAQSMSGSRATARLRTLKSAQELLGRMHDLEVLIARTRSIQSSPEVSSLKVSAELDRLVRRLETECRQLHGQYMGARSQLVALANTLTAGRSRSARTPAA